MPNQPMSPNGQAFIGTTTGPIDQMWEEWQRVNATEIMSNDPEQVAYIKFVFYSCCTLMYNTVMTVIRSDNSMNAFVTVSEAMRLNLTRYFDEDDKPTIN